jgi:hypothetical protein
MIRSKKADVGTLALIIIVLASAAVLGGFVYKWGTGAKEESKVEACRMSILNAARSKQLNFQAPLLSIDCPRGQLGDIILRKKDIVEDNKIDVKKAHRIIAEGMKECWHMVGEGLYDPFSAWEGADTSYCLICKTVYFDDDLIDFMNNERIPQEHRVIPPIGEYLAITKILKGKKTYWGYLYKETPPDQSNLNEMAAITRDTIVFPQSQIILNMHRKEERWETFYYIGVVLGTILSVGAIVVGILLAIPTGGISVSLIAVGLTALAGIAGPAMLYYTGTSAFEECEECNAVGGISFIPPGTDLTMEIQVQLEKGEEPEEIPLCSFLVN